MRDLELFPEDVNKNTFKRYDNAKFHFFEYLQGFTVSRNNN